MQNPKSKPKPQENTNKKSKILFFALGFSLDFELVF
jgi:hypothetical protein